MIYNVDNLEETKKLAKDFSLSLKKGDVVLLRGDLGAGKTTFTQFVFKFLGVKEVVNSPTFAVLKSYQADSFTLHHFDTYRITTEEAIECGFDETINDKESVVFIEWADMVKELIPQKHIAINIKHAGGDKRIFEIEKVGKYE